MIKMLKMIKMMMTTTMLIMIMMIMINTIMLMNILCINGHNLVTLGLPRSRPGEKNRIKQRLHLSPLSVIYYLHLTKNET